MLIGWRGTLAALAVCTFFVGACTPTAEGTREDQKNPFYLAGKERVQAMDYTGAVESFEKSLQENPRSVLAHFELGLVHEQHLGDYATALYHYNKALKLRPSGYPAETIKQRIPACRQELLKADSLAVVNPAGLRETERLREENQDLRRQLMELKTALAGAPRLSGTDIAVAFGAGGTNRLGQSGTGATTSNTNSTDRARIHVVRPGETLAGISRTQNVKLNSLLAANPGLDPKRLKVGQTIKIPLR